MRRQNNEHRMERHFLGHGAWTGHWRTEEGTGYPPRAALRQPAAARSFSQAVMSALRRSAARHRGGCTSDRGGLELLDRCRPPARAHLPGLASARLGGRSAEGRFHAVPRWVGGCHVSGGMRRPARTRASAATAAAATLPDLVSRHCCGRVLQKGHDHGDERCATRASSACASPATSTHPTPPPKPTPYTMADVEEPVAEGEEGACRRQRGATLCTGPPPCFGALC